jgi:hypothetical protein
MADLNLNLVTLSTSITPLVYRPNQRVSPETKASANVVKLLEFRIIGSAALISGYHPNHPRFHAVWGVCNHPRFNLAGRWCAAPWR